ncbi:hypothetical protein PYW07_011834 [Mythimna separata]|uniref:H15 domain-containing protein n=1 Tax=Mythimna separata TaxID=271217 RepID=A0AAD7Y6X4_MYTSE|nr:hypothetical protein PYW07_011834 [Mythimna separata]
MASEGSDSEGSDINIKSALPKQMTNKKTPKSPTTDALEKKGDKKLTTKLMIIQALVDLKSRKGVSLQAIKKYIAERYNVDTEKMNYYIKKSIKSAVEDGTIIQTKGIGASGSFKLAPVKEKKPKMKKKPKKEKTEKTKDPEKKKKLKEKAKKTEEKGMKVKEKSKKPEGKSLKAKVAKENKEDKVVKPSKPKKKKMETEKKPKEKKQGGEKIKKVKITAEKKTPTKKKATMAKRKSIGSIIKPPKMKPRPKA